MRSASWCAAMILVSLTGGGMAASPVEFFEADVCEAAVGPTCADADEVTNTVGRSIAAQSLPLTEEQRGLVFLGVMSLPEAPELDMSAPAPAAALPDAVELQDLPAVITNEIPLLQDHKFVKLFDRILLVRSADRIVVSEIPRYRLLP